MRHRQNKQGFTLIELSIVLLIIGIIAGSVMAGQSLIKASKLRSVSADIDKFRGVVETFQQQYSYYPGDFPHASDYFTSGCGTGNAAAPAGCNGNGDGAITGTTESARAWQHLQFADMLQGNLNGTVGTACTPGTNAPVSKIRNNVGYSFDQNASQAYTSNRPSYVTLITMGTDNSTVCSGAAISVNDAYQIDAKSDDGVPTTGGVMAMGANCLSGSDFDSSQAGESVCALLFTLN